MKRYKEQHRCVSEVVRIFESPEFDDGPDAEKKKLKSRVSELMAEVSIAAESFIGQVDLIFLDSASHRGHRCKRQGRLLRKWWARCPRVLRILQASAAQEVPGAKIAWLCEVNSKCTAAQISRVHLSVIGIVQPLSTRCVPVIIHCTRRRSRLVWRGKSTSMPGLSDLWGASSPSPLSLDLQVHSAVRGCLRTTFKGKVRVVCKQLSRCHPSQHTKLRLSQARIAGIYPLRCEAILLT